MPVQAISPHGCEAGARSTAAPRLGWLDAVVLLGILVLGSARLPAPLAGDQALNLLMGEVIADGGAPYSDLWDLKHAGVFLFNAAGGAIFGFDELGIHLFEFVWMLMLALLVRVLAGRWLESAVAVRLAPALTVGIYYAVASERYLTQTESLVGLPLLASLWCAVEGLRHRRQVPVWLAASGLCGGIVAVFKLPLLAIPIFFWMLIVAALTSSRRERARAIAAAVAWLVVGLVLPIAATIGYFVRMDVAAMAVWTYFQHPAEAWQVTTLDFSRLARSARSFVVAFAPILALACLASVESLRERRVDLITIALCGWLVFGVLLIVSQVISWWDYHFFLLVVPSGLLAAKGFEVGVAVTRSLVGPARSREALALGGAALLVAFTPQLAMGTSVIANTWRSRPLPFSRAGVAAYQAVHYEGYAAIRQRTAFLREPRSHPGPIYVIDTPAYYPLAGRPSALPLLAPWFHPTDRLWARFCEDVLHMQAPYVRLSEHALETLVAYRPSGRDDVARMVTVIEQRYVVLSRDADGTWYVRRDLASGG